MVRLGHVYGDLMVGVKPLNAKLRRRARDLVASAAGVSPRRAAALLDAAGGDTKTALLMGLASVDARRARSLLRDAGGSVREAARRARR